MGRVTPDTLATPGIGETRETISTKSASSLANGSDGARRACLAIGLGFADASSGGQRPLPSTRDHDVVCRRDVEHSGTADASSCGRGITLPIRLEPV